MINCKTITLTEDLKISKDTPRVIKNNCIYDGKDKFKISFEDNAVLIIDGKENTIIRFKNVTFENLKNNTIDDQKIIPTIKFGKANNQKIEMESVTLYRTPSSRQIFALYLGIFKSTFMQSC